jgi:hypothetical protein
MPENLTLDTFAGRLGEIFRLRLDDGSSLPLRLDAATPGGEPYALRGRVPFAIEFSGPVDSIVPQRIYRLDHDELGPLEIFLVPMAPDAAGARYQAVFS